MRVTDWTRAAGNGGRWGISPGRVHLGGTTLSACGGNFSPADCGFGIPPGRRGEYDRRMRAWDDIRQQAARAELLSAFRERADAIRRRKERERATKDGPS